MKPTAICGSLLLLSMFVHGSIAQDKAPQRVSERELDNLVAFARLVGYVRHFHPSDEAAGANWDIVAIEGFEAVEKAHDAGDLAERLEKFFKPLAPTLRVFVTGKRPADGGKVAEPKEATRLLVWRHFSVPVPRKPDNVSSTRIDLKRDKMWPDKLAPQPATPEPGKPFGADLGGGVSCIVPLALFADDKGTLPRGDREYLKQFVSRPKGFVPSSADRATRLAAIAMAWNTAQHFFPYFDVVKVDWPKELRHYLARAAAEPGDVDFSVILYRMLAGLQDGHLTVQGPKLGENFFPPVRWDWVEERLTVIRASKEHSAKIKPGDVVLKIDGQPAQAVVEKKMNEVGGANVGFKRRAALSSIGIGKKDTEMELEIQSGQPQPQIIKLPRQLAFAEFRELGSEPRPQPQPLCEIKPGIWYVDVGRATQKEYETAVPKLEKATGIIFDVRGYPIIPLEILLQHFVDEPTPFLPTYMPIVPFPDRQSMSFMKGNSGSVQPKAPRLRAKVAYLTDARAISAAETYLAFAEHHKVGPIVGSPTAGTNGNVRVVTVPGGYEIQITGIKVLQHDGSTFHGRGVPITLPVQRTVKGVAEGRDEVLQRGVECVSA